MVIRRANGFILGTVLFLYVVLIPSVSFADWVKAYSFALFEYGDPAYARTGTYDIYYNAQLTNPPYGFPYAVVVSIGAVCSPPYVVLFGGVEVGWINSFITDPAWVTYYDPYADGAVGVAFDPTLNDGSFGTTVECPGTSPDTGYHWLFVYPPQNQYHDQLGQELGDLYICESNRWGSGCRWYHVFVP